MPLARRQHERSPSKSRYETKALRSWKTQFSKALPYSSERILEDLEVALRGVARDAGSAMSLVNMYFNLS